MPVARIHRAFPLILLLLVGLPALRAVAADEGPADWLQKARLLEFVEAEHADAIRLYKKVYEAEEVEERHRSEAMLGAARCFMARGEPDEAAIWWRRALDAPGTSEPQKRIAKAELAKRDAVNKEKADDEQWRERWKQVEEGRKEEARRALEKAWDAWRRDDVREARAQVYYSMSIIGETDSHRELLRKIEASRPDREELVRNLMQFFQTAQIQHYQELRTTVHEHYITGKRLFRQGGVGPSRRVLPERHHQDRRRAASSATPTSWGGTNSRRTGTTSRSGSDSRASARRRRASSSRKSRPAPSPSRAEPGWPGSSMGCWRKHSAHEGTKRRSYVSSSSRPPPPAGSRRPSEAPASAVGSRSRGTRAS